MNIRFYNIRVLINKNRSFSVLEDGEVWVQDSYITYVGKKKERVIANFWDREIDGKNNLLMPGFKNAHSHSAMTFLRSYADNAELNTWLYKYIFPMEKYLSPELVYWATVLANLEYISSGITSNFDMYYFPEMIAKAAIDTGFRTVQTSPISKFSSNIYELEENYNRINDMSELTSYILGFHAEYTASKELLQGISKLAKKYRAPVWFHNAETKSEVLDCIMRWKITPTKLAESLGLYEYGGGGYHCVWLDECDFEVFKKYKLSAVINSASNLKLNSGIAPVKDLLNYGINVALGTDGAASNNSLDMFKEMFLTATLSKMRENNAKSLDAEQVIYMATTAAADAMGLINCNSISEGKKADLIILDLHQPNMQPMNNVFGNIVYSGSKNNIALTMINGKILYEKGEFLLRINPEDVYHEISKLITKIENKKKYGKP